LNKQHKSHKSNVLKSLQTKIMFQKLITHSYKSNCEV